MSRILYILAPSHSGSTLLALLLGSHPEMCTVGELKATSLGNAARYRCSCGELILECPFWQQVSAKMAQQGFDYKVTAAGTDIRSGMSPLVERLLNPLHRGPALEAARDAMLALLPTWRRRYPEIQARNAALAQAVLEITGKRVLIDSSKIGIRLKYLLRNPKLDVRVVRLVRDGRGVALTYMNPAEFADARDARLKEGGMGGDRAHQRLSVTEAARVWRKATEEADAIVRQLPADRYVEVRYEEYCAAPEQTLRRIFAFAGVDPDAPRRDFRQANAHVVGNGMRFDSTSDITMDERWKQVLTQGDLDAFDSEAGALRRRLGYL